MRSDIFHHYWYLHGFASGPQSQKAQSLKARCSLLNISLKIHDLNQGDFTHLTLTRQIQQLQDDLPANLAPVTLIGSSLGGLTALWAAQQFPQIHQVVAIAPAFELLSQWLPQLGPEKIQQWQRTGHLAVYHHEAQKSLPLDYGFVTDLQQYPDLDLSRPVPTLILHGTEDTVIPIESSRRFIQHRPWAQLVELPGDHGLLAQEERLWQEIVRFCGWQPSSASRDPSEISDQGWAQGLNTGRVKWKQLP